MSRSRNSSNDSRKPVSTRRWSSTFRRPPRGTSWARMPLPTSTYSRSGNGQPPTRSGLWPSALTAPRIPRKRPGRRSPKPSATSAAATSSTCTRPSTGSAVRSATPTKTAARRPPTTRNFSDQKTGTLSGGGAVGFLANTPDGTAFAFNANADYFVHQNVSFGPLFQLAATGDLFQFGLSGQGKLWIDLPGTEHKARLVLQGGF